MAPTALVVMGVSGSGKSTVGKELAQRLHWPYDDGDAFHSPENVAKMAAGIPLTDADRWPWLERVERSMAETLHAGSSCVVACSALRKSYRDLLRGAAGADPGAAVRFVFLDVDRDLLRQRLIARHGHFMHADMLASQLATLEPPTAAEGSITIPITANIEPAETVDKIIDALSHGGTEDTAVGQGV
jgi:carbohydrate kinase (thermoresistant glucokinase family)